MMTMRVSHAPLFCARGGAAPPSHARRYAWPLLSCGGETGQGGPAMPVVGSFLLC